MSDNKIFDQKNLKFASLAIHGGQFPAPSIGIEDIDDLIEDIRNALESL